MPDTHDRPLHRARPWIPLALGVLAIVIGGALYSPQPGAEPVSGPVGDVSAAP